MLENGGRIVLTCPEDYRPFEEQGFSMSKDEATENYAKLEAIAGWHSYPVTKAVIQEWVECAGLEVAEWGFIDYVFTHPTGGWGAVVVADLDRPAGQACDIPDGAHAGELRTGEGVPRSAPASGQPQPASASKVTSRPRSRAEL